MQVSAKSRSVAPYNALPLTYAFAPAANVLLKDSAHPGLKTRDLLLASASRNQMSAYELRAERAGTLDGWAGAETSNFRFLYLLGGEITFDLPGQVEVSLAKGDVVHQPFLAAVDKGHYSADFAAVEIVAPGVGNSMTTQDPLLQMHAPSFSGNWDHAVNREEEKAYVSGMGPRKFFHYRDLGTAALTENRIHIHVVSAIETMPGGTGWHDHSMSQLFMVLRGEAVIAVEGHGESRILTGDTMTINAGMKHNVSSFSPDYLVLEMCLPADYKTTPRPAPLG